MNKGHNMYLKRHKLFIQQNSTTDEKLDMKTYNMENRETFEFFFCGALIPLQKNTYFNMNHDKKHNNTVKKLQEETTKSKELEQWKDETIEFLGKTFMCSVKCLSFSPFPFKFP